MARKDVKYIEFDTPNAPKLMVDADASIEQIRDILKSGSFEEYMMGQGFAYKYGLQPVNTRLPENLDDNAFVSSAKSTIKNLQGIGTNLLAAIYDVFGNEEAQQNALKIYEQYKLDQAAYMFRQQDDGSILPRPRTIEDVLDDPNQLRAFSKYLGATVSQGAVSSVPIALATIAGSLVGGPIGGSAMLLASSYLFGIGDIYGAQYDAAGDGEDPNAAIAFSLGIPYALAERVFGASSVFINKSIGKKTFEESLKKNASQQIKQKVKKVGLGTYPKNLAKEMASVGAREAVAETIQETLNITGGEFLEVGKSFEETYLNADFAKQIGEAAAAGFFGGFGFGIVRPTAKQFKSFIKKGQYNQRDIIGTVTNYDDSPGTIEGTDLEVGDSVQVAGVYNAAQITGNAEDKKVQDPKLTIIGTTPDSILITLADAELTQDGALRTIEVPKSDINSIFKKSIQVPKDSSQGVNFKYDDDIDDILNDNQESRTAFSEAKKKLEQQGFLDNSTNQEVDTKLDRKKQVEQLASQIESARINQKEAEAQEAEIENLPESEQPIVKPTQADNFLLSGAFKQFDMLEGDALRDAINRSWPAFRRQQVLELAADKENENNISKKDRDELGRLGYYDGDLGNEWVNKNIVADTRPSGNSTVGRKKLKNILSNKIPFSDTVPVNERTVMEVVGEDVQTIEPLTKEERASITGEGLADPNAGPTYIFNINVSQRIREIKEIAQYLDARGWKIIGAPWYPAYRELVKVKTREVNQTVDPILRAKLKAELKQLKNTGYHILQNPFLPKDSPFGLIMIGSPSAIRTSEQAINNLNRELQTAQDPARIKRIKEEIVGYQALIDKAYSNRVRINQLLSSLTLEPITNWEQFNGTVSGLSALEKRLNQTETITKRRKIKKKTVKFSVMSNPQPRLRESFLNNATKIAQILRRQLDRLGLTQLQLQVLDKVLSEQGFEANGKYLIGQKLVQISLNAKLDNNIYDNQQDATLYTLHHEVIHALKDLGLFTKKEYDALYNAAINTWINQFNIKQKYPDLNLEEQAEEAISEAFAHYMVNRFSTGTILKRAFKRLKAFILMLGNSLRQGGFNNVTDIFEMIDAGIIGQRDRAIQDTVNNRGVPDNNTDVRYYPDPGAAGMDSRAPMNRQEHRKTNRQIEKLSKQMNSEYKGEGGTTSPGKMSAFTRFLGHYSRIAQDFPIFTPLYNAVQDRQGYANMLTQQLAYALGRTYLRVQNIPAAKEALTKAHIIAQMTGGNYRRNAQGQIIFTAPANSGDTNSSVKAGETVILTGDVATAYENHAQVMLTVNEIILKDMIAGEFSEDIKDAILLINKFLPLNRQVPNLKQANKEQVNLIIEEMKLADGQYLLDQLNAIMMAYQNRLRGFESGLLMTEEDITNLENVSRRINDGFMKEAKQFEDRIKNDYAPLMRYGNLFITVKDSDDRLIDYRQIEPEGVLSSILPFGIKPGLESKAEQIKRELQLQYPDATVSEPTEVNIEQLRQVYKEELMSVDTIAGFLSDTNAKKYAEFRKALDTKLKLDLDVERGKERRYTVGFRNFFRPRNTEVGAEGVPGYDSDFTRSTLQFIQTAAQATSRNRFNKSIQDKFKIVTDEATRSNDKNLLESVGYWMDYSNDVSNEYAYIRRLGFIWYLGGNLSSAFLQTISMVQFTGPMLAELVNPKFIPGVGFGRVSKALANGAALATKSLAKGAKDGSMYEDALLNIDAIPDGPKKDAILRAIADGTIKQGQAMMEAGASNLMGGSAAQQNLNKIQNVIVGGAFNTMEFFSRLSAYSAAYDLASSDPQVLENAKVLFEDDHDFQFQIEENNGELTPEILARYMTNRAFGVYGKINRQAFGRGVGSVFGLFMTYVSQMMGLFTRLANPPSITKTERGYRIQPLYPKRGRAQSRAARRTMARMSLMILLTAGLFGMPGGEEAEDIVNAVRKYTTGIDSDIRYEFRKMLYEIGFSPRISEFATAGAFNAFLNMDLQRRIGFGQLPWSQQFRAILGAFTGANTGARVEEFMGAPGSIVTTASNAVATSYREGSVYPMVEALVPNALKNVHKAYRYATKGEAYTGYGTLLSEDFGASDIVLQAAGFTPASIAREREALRLERKIGGATNTFRNKINAQITNAYVDMIQGSKNNDSDRINNAQKDLNELMIEVQNFNSTAPLSMIFFPDLDRLYDQALQSVDPAYRISKKNKEKFNEKYEMRAVLGLN